MRLAPAIPGMTPRCLPVWQPLAAHSEAGAAWSKWANFITNCLTSNKSKLKTCPFPFSAWSHDNQSYQSSTSYDTILYTLKKVLYVLENFLFRISKANCCWWYGKLLYRIWDKTQKIWLSKSALTIIKKTDFIQPSILTLVLTTNYLIFLRSHWFLIFNFNLNFTLQDPSIPNL